MKIRVESNAVDTADLLELETFVHLILKGVADHRSHEKLFVRLAWLTTGVIGSIQDAVGSHLENLNARSIPDGVTAEDWVLLIVRRIQNSLTLNSIFNVYAVELNLKYENPYAELALYRA